MTDVSLQLLLARVATSARPALLLLDEQGGAVAPPPARSDVAMMSNRADVCTHWRQAGWSAAFSDFDLAADGPAAGSQQTVLLRAMKEKPLMHHLINAAAVLLAEGGRLLLAGGKQEGIKTYARTAAKRLGGDFSIGKQGTAYLAEIVRGRWPGPPLEDRDYARLRLLPFPAEPQLYSKPGVFGWDKIDAGSALLVTALPALFAQAAPQRVCDLGCGYGYLSVHAWLQQPRPARLLATDNNAAALAACRANFDLHGIVGEVVAADCAADVAEAFDLVLCNPPFHRGFAVQHELAARFVAAARRLLAAGGQAVFVTNAFVPLERLAAEHFPVRETLADDGRFRVTRLGF